MPIVPAKVVTIISSHEAQYEIEDKLKNLGVTGWSFSAIKGRGVKGNRTGGFSDGDNVSVTVITSEPIATELINWTVETLSPINPSVAYMVDAQAGRRPPKT